MRIIWSPAAIAQLADIRTYIEKDKPEAALAIAKRIVEAVDRLEKNPRLGAARPSSQYARIDYS